MGRVVTEPDGKVADAAVAQLFRSADVESQVDFVDRLIENSEDGKSPDGREDLTAAFGALYREAEENQGTLEAAVGKLLSVDSEDVDLDQSDEAITREVVEEFDVDDDVADRFLEGLAGDREPISAANDFFAQVMNEAAREVQSSRIGGVLGSLSGLSRYTDDGPGRAVANARDLAEIVAEDLEADEETWLFSPASVESPAADGVDDEGETEAEGETDERGVTDREAEKAENLDTGRSGNAGDDQLSW